MRLYPGLRDALRHVLWTPVVSGGRLAARLTYLLANVRRRDTGELWTSKDLVDAVNASGVPMSYSYFSSLKVGSRDNPDEDLLRAIAAVFGVRAGTLINAVSEIDTLPPSLPTGVLTTNEIDILHRIAQAFIAEHATWTSDPAPYDGSADGLTSQDAYAASALVDVLTQAADRLREDMPSADLAAQMAADVEALAGKIRAHFLLATTDSQPLSDPAVDARSAS